MKIGKAFVGFHQWIFGRIVFPRTHTVLQQHAQLIARLNIDQYQGGKGLHPLERFTPRLSQRPFVILRHTNNFHQNNTHIKWKQFENHQHYRNNFLVDLRV
jgi:hypothetical protein